MNRQTAFVADRIFTGITTETGKAVLVDEGEVTSVVDASGIPSMYEVRDFGDALLAPALMDLQIYGGNGKLFSADPGTDALDAIYAYCKQGGCTRYMITMATNSLEKFLQGLTAVRAYWDRGGKGLLGLHLEGPYINPVKKGAHLEQYIKKPTLGEVKRLLEKGGTAFRMMTLAPEQCDDAVIDLLLQNDVLVSAGHSNATYAEGMRGFKMGIPTATHLFNAMSPLQGREPGMVGAVLDAGCMSSVVCDGIHVDFASIRISKKLMKENLFYITDAVTEVAQGEYQHVFKKDRYTLPSGTLSGSALTMLQAVRNGFENLGITAEESLRMASLYPARLLKMEDMFGCIKPGAVADFIALGQKLSLRALVVGGSEDFSVSSAFSSAGRR